MAGRPISPLRIALWWPLLSALAANVVGASTTAQCPLAGKSSIVQPDCLAGHYAARRLSVCSHTQICTSTVRAQTPLAPRRKSTMRTGRATPPNSSMTF